MADTLNLSLWFPGFDAELMLPRLIEVLRYFPFSEERGGVQYVSVQPVDWAEPTLFEQGWSPGVSAEEAAEALREHAQSDFALTMEAYWDLWVLSPQDTNSGRAGDPGLSPQHTNSGCVGDPGLSPQHAKQWVLTPQKVTFTAQGLEFDEGAFAESGHILIDFGLDFPFLQEEASLGPDDALRVRANVAALVEFIHRIERNCHTTGRVLWSESDDNLAQKLIARLQQVQ
jgi:hypothetical protein